MYMTFEAVTLAVESYLLSFPVICLDACTIKSPNTSAVLLTASYGTTNGHLLSMCFGTAPTESNESWGFFLLNLRQVLCRYAVDWSKVVFMSDRHRGLLHGVKTHFPESRHLFCVVHLLRNIFGAGLKTSFFWSAVEATTEKEFNESLASLISSSSRATLLSNIEPQHWSRFAISSSKCRRFYARRNNWAESLNNSMMKLRCGPVLAILINCFQYTNKRLVEFHDETKDLVKDVSRTVTGLATRVFDSNQLLSNHCCTIVR